MNVYYSMGAMGTDGDIDSRYEMLAIEPESLLAFLSKETDIFDVKKSDELNFLKCPAFQDYAKQLYVIKSPVTVTVKIMGYDGLSIVFKNADGEKLKDQGFYGRLTSVRKSEKYIGLTLPPKIHFWSDEKCVIDSIPVPLDLNTEFAKKCRIVPGSFDINSWFRPLENTFIIAEGETEFTINRGDPLFCVKFNNGKVEMIRKEYSKDMYKLTTACVSLKDMCPRKKLSESYQYFSKMRYMYNIYKKSFFRQLKMLLKI